MGFCTCSQLSAVASKLAPTWIATVAISLAGCATPGSNHIYLTTQADPAVHDLSASATTSLPQAVTVNERVLGLAYDYNTDHLFIRVWPGQIIRVIERPSRKILREMPLATDLHAQAPADLAVRSSDRHLFVVHPDRRSVVELSLFGVNIRRLELPASTMPITGLAFDQKSGHLLTLTDNIIRAYTATGQLVRTITLQTSIRSVTLGYDSDAGHFFVPLAVDHTLGEFDASGILVQRHPTPGNAEITGLDAGPRSLVRVF